MGINICCGFRAVDARDKYPGFILFISFLQIDMQQVVEILPSCKIGTYLFYIVNIMGADILVMQGVRASANHDIYYVEPE